MHFFTHKRKWLRLEFSLATPIIRIFVRAFASILEAHLKNTDRSIHETFLKQIKQKFNDMKYRSKLVFLCILAAFFLFLSWDFLLQPDNQAASRTRAILTRIHCHLCVRLAWFQNKHLPEFTILSGELKCTCTVLFLQWCECLRSVRISKLYDGCLFKCHLFAASWNQTDHNLQCRWLPWPTANSFAQSVI